MVSPDEPAPPSCPTIRSRPRPGPADMFRAAEGRWGSREVEITDVRLAGRRRRTGPRLSRPASGSTCGSRLRAPLPIEDFVVGIGIFNAEGVCCYGTNTYIEDLDAASAWPATPRRVFSIESLDLVEGTYKLDVAIHKMRRLSVRLPPPALHLPREVAREGRRHLSTAHAWRFERRRQVQAGRRRRVMNLAGSSRLRSTRFVHDARAAGRRIVFTNGVFDLLHPGPPALSPGGPRARRSADRRAELRRVGPPQQGAGATDDPERERAELLARARMRRRGLDLRRGHARRHHHAGPARCPRERRGLARRSDRRPRHGRSPRRHVIREPVEQGYSTSALIQKARST